MKRQFSILACCAVLLTWPAAHASPMLKNMWTDVSFHTEGGAQVQAATDKRYALTKLQVSKRGKTFVADAALLAQITNVNLNSITVYEDIFLNGLVVRIHSDFFDNESGDIVKTRKWSIHLLNGGLSNLTFEDQAVK
ncbi:hypothetical protein V8J88_21775 [Massilia sp. W12]|uniref:hypothetical protein n=1 Tax=Massilia sp. W12 TaxID=3126507 RepID=UPI0030D6116E